MRYCSRCVMPETAETLGFDEQGVCSVCRQIEVKQDQIDWGQRGQDLDALIEQYRGKHDYDCIVPFSGGKDSAFTLWYLVTVKKLKCLVVRFDHGFMRPTIEDNCLKTLRRLGCDIVKFTPNWQVVRKLMYEALKRRGDFCWHCHTGIFSFPMWEALRHQVPLVFWGEPSSEYSSFYGYHDVEEHDERRFNRVINLGINAEDMLGMLDNSVSDYPVTLRDLKPFTFPPARDLRKLGVKSVFLGHFVPWDVRRQVDIIKRELDWKGDQVEGVPPEYDYEKIECFVQGVRDYIKWLKRGFGRTTHVTSIDIRNHRMDRETAEKLVAEYDGKRPAALDIFLDILGIDEQHFMDLVEPHVVAPRVMPSCESCQSNCNTDVPWDYGRWQEAVAMGKLPEAAQ